MGSVIEITNSNLGIISGNLARRYGTYENSDITITDCVKMSVVSNSTEGDIVVTRTPETNLDGNKARSIQLVDSDKSVVSGSSVIGGAIVVTGSDDSSILGNSVVRDGLGATPWAVIVDGNADGVVVTNNVYQGVPHGSVEAVADAGIHVAAGVTNTSIGWNHLGKAVEGVDDNGTGTVHLDLVPFTFGTDANPIVAGGGNQPFPYSGSGVIVGVRVVVGVAPSGSSIIVDLNVNGSSLWAVQGSQPTIAVAGTDSGVVKPDQNAALSDGDVFTVDVDQVGSGVAGGYLTAVVYVRQNGA